jgi:apolipoprotein N-acyltransferase
VSRARTRYGAAILSALLSAAAFPPLGWSWLAWVSLAPWLAVLQRDRGEGHRGPGFVFGLVFFTTGLAWLGRVHLAFPLLLSAILALYPLLFAWLFRRVAALGPDRAALALPFLWVGVDLLREHLASGFPWLQQGHALAGWTRLRQAADLGGAHLLTFVAVAFNARLAAGIAPRVPVPGGERPPAADRRAGPRLALGALALALPLVLSVYGGWRLGTLRDGPGPRVVLVQPSFPQTLKAEAAHLLPRAEEMVDRQVALSIEGVTAHPRTDLVLWAETMIPGLLREAQRGRDVPDRETTTLLHRIADPAGVVPGGTRRLLAGAVLLGKDGRKRNAALLVGPLGAVEGRFDKEHLTPFGEYLPGADLLSEGGRESLQNAAAGVLPFLPDLVPGASEPVPLVLPGGRTVRLGGLVCYEVIFPAPSRARVRAGADVLVNLSNYAWYGAGMREQALDMTRLRAVEARRPVVTCTNDGPTAVVDGNGEVRSRLAEGARGFLAAEVPLDGRSSPSASRGDLFAGLCALHGAAAAAAGWRAGRRGGGAPPGPGEATRGKS